jgi:F-type H+-transporting ATPase subunit a
MGIQISMAPEPIFRIAGFAITNSMMTTLLVMAFLTVLAYVGTRRMSLVPNSRVQNLLEWVVEFLLSLSENTAGKKVGRKVFPLIATLFIFILAANWAGLLPGFGSIYLVEHGGEHVPLFRAANSDMNTTAAMALISITVVQFVGFTINGTKRYLKELTTPIFLTPIHLIGELSHIISLTARLFGNVFGGEVLMVVMYTLVPYVLPAVFLGLEAFFGFIQALIFTVLTTVYITLAAGHGAFEADGHAA